MEYQDKQIKTAGNSGFALWGLTCFVEPFVQGSTFVLRMNICAKNPPQRKAAKRYHSLLGQNFDRQKHMGRIIKNTFLTLLLTLFGISYGQKDSVTTPVIQAQFPGGQMALMKYLKANVSDKANYPDNGVPPEKLIAKFFVDENGKTTDTKIIKSSGHQYIDKLFIQAINDMPNWTPAENPKGKKVRQEIKIPMYLCAK